jgi:hypothetical protein
MSVKYKNLAESRLQRAGSDTGENFFGFVNQQIDTTRKYKNICNIAGPRAPFQTPGLQ